MLDVETKSEQTKMTPRFRPTMFAALAARLLLEEVAAGRWQKLSDGRLVPVDAATDTMVESEHGSVIPLTRKEGKRNAAL
jgi:hypothetical protein